MKRSSDRILTTHVGSLIRPQALQDFLRAKQSGKPYDEKAYQTCLADSVAEVVRQQAEDRHRRVSDGEFGKSISLVAIRARAPVRLRAPPDQERDRQSVQARRRPHALCRILRRARRARRRRHHHRSDLRRADPIYRAGRAAARHRQFQGRAQGREGRRGLPAGGGAGERDPRPQERILQERRRAAGGDRASHAHRIQDDHRRRLPGAARRRAQRRHL